MKRQEPLTKCVLNRWMCVCWCWSACRSVAPTKTGGESSSATTEIATRKREASTKVWTRRKHFSTRIAIDLRRTTRQHHLAAAVSARELSCRDNQWSFMIIPKSEIRIPLQLCKFTLLLLLFFFYKRPQGASIMKSSLSGLDRESFLYFGCFSCQSSLESFSCWNCDSKNYLNERHTKLDHDDWCVNTLASRSPNQFRRKEIKAPIWMANFVPSDSILSPRSRSPEMKSSWFWFLLLPRMRRAERRFEDRQWCSDGSKRISMDGAAKLLQQILLR